MALSDRIKRQLFDGVDFVAQDATNVTTPAHLFMDTDQQIRMGVAGVYGGLGVVANVIEPVDAQVPVYSSQRKVWESTAISTANVSTGTFLANQWTVDGDVATFTISHNMNTQNVDVTVFDTTSGVPTETYVDIQSTSTGSARLVIAASAVFPGIFVVTSITGSGAAASIGGGTAVRLLNLGNVSGETAVNWGQARLVSVTLTDDTVLNLAALGNTVADKVTVKVTQNATGGNFLYWSTNVKWPSGFQPDGTLDASATDYYEFLWDGSSFVSTDLIQNVS